MSSCKTHIVLFKSPRDVRQVAILNVQLGLGSTLIDWFWDASSVTFGHLLIDLSPRTDDRSRYCTNGGNFPSKLYVPENLKHLKNLDGEHTKSLYFPSITTFFPRMQNSVSKNLSKKIYPISQRVHRQLAAKKLVRKNKKSRAKVQRQNSWTVSIKKQLGSNEKVFFRRKKYYCSFKPSSPQFFFLSTTAATTQPLSQNKNYPKSNLSKLPRNTKIR